jgi:hypothetical protein
MSNKSQKVANVKWGEKSDRVAKMNDDGDERETICDSVVSKLYTVGKDNIYKVRRYKNGRAVKDVTNVISTSF